MHTAADARTKPGARLVKVGLFYELFDDYQWRSGDPADADAEYEPEDTLLAIEEGFRRLNCTTMRIGGARNLLDRLDSIDVDFAFNISEGARSRNREAYVPILLELAGIPCIGSDALTLSLSLDKAATKDLVAKIGVLTPEYEVYGPGNEALAASCSLPFPVFVKPRYEGSSKSIRSDSRVDDREALPAIVRRITHCYGQDALVESFIGAGGEFTVCVVGNEPPRALPVLQRALERRTRIGLHAFDRRGADEADDASDYVLGATLTSELEAEISRSAIAVYEKLECKDFARMDFRTDGEGRVWFLEANPLPTFAPDGTFAITAELLGRAYVDFLAEIFESALRRLGLR